MAKIMHSKLKTLNLIAAFNCLLQNSSCFVLRSTALLGLVSMRACLRAFKIGKRGVLFAIFALSFHSSIHCLALYSELSTAARGKG